MSRAIKYRVWDKMQEKMYQVTNIRYDADSGNIMGISGKGLPYNTFVNGLELLQYIGIKDCKGQEIYEGDILEFNDDKGSYRAVIDYVYSGFVLRPVNCMIPNIEMEHWTVIGNVYEHPHLLNRSNEA